MRALVLACLLGVGAAACQGDTFEAPPRPDLYKDPYDLGASTTEGSDLAQEPAPDLRPPDSSPDLAKPPEGHPDLSQPDLAPPDEDAG